VIRYLGAKAIAAAVGVKPETVRTWRKAQLRGETPPILLKVTRTGRLWVSAADVDEFFTPPVSAHSAFVQGCLDSLDRKLATRCDSRRAH
jgi:hypothetical protein